MDTDTIFTGNVILVYLVDPPKEFVSGIAISKPKIEEKLGRNFIVGNVPENRNDWSSGLPISVAFDQIVHYLEFESVTDFLKRGSGGLMDSGD